MDDDVDEVQLWREFGRELEGLRIERGLDRRQLADQSKISYHTIMTLEQGGRTTGGVWVTPNPKDEHLAALARVVGVPVDRWYARVGRYSDRPRTKQSRTGVGLRRAREDADLRRELREMEADLRKMEERADRVEELLRQHGIDVGEEPPEEPPKPRRRGRAS
jgi:transcriptional regulator with XRE-family HTH domain